ncbi:hypothetical protein XA3_01340 [Xylocopilactobacillus apicola]|uniref:PbsX family transcriptional regulator n=1 Tax=Xylocopilactobacillus apicola TaxID=2932184 RepID=A0AAU9DUY9_9LACO|nr:hypothetical protein XA3_01340 [Xylocopilactobacillus apicola]
MQTQDKKRASNIHELFADWQDDGYREHEIDWGKSQGNELSWKKDE